MKKTLVLALFLLPLSLSAQTVISPSGMTLLSSQTLNGASSAQFSLPSGYHAFVVQFGAFTWSTSATIVMQFSADGGTTWDATAANYITTVSFLTSGGVTGNLNSTTATGIQLVSGATTTLSGNLTISNTAGATNGQAIIGILLNGVATQETFGCRHSNANGAVNAVQLLPSAGTISGTLALYGIP